MMNISKAQEKSLFYGSFPVMPNTAYVQVMNRLTHGPWLDNPHYPEHNTKLRNELSELRVCVVYSQDALESSLRIYLLKQNSNFQILWLWLAPGLNKSAIKKKKKTTHTHFGDNQVNLTMDWVLDIREIMVTFIRLIIMLWLYSYDLIYYRCILKYLGINIMVSIITFKQFRKKLIK